MLRRVLLSASLSMPATGCFTIGLEDKQSTTVDQGVGVSPDANSLPSDNETDVDIGVSEHDISETVCAEIDAAFSQVSCNPVCTEDGDVFCVNGNFLLYRDSDVIYLFDDRNSRLPIYIMDAWGSVLYPEYRGISISCDLEHVERLKNETCDGAAPVSEQTGEPEPVVNEPDPGETEEADSERLECTPYTGRGHDERYCCVAGVSGVVEHAFRGFPLDSHTCNDLPDGVAERLVCCDG